MTNFLPPLPGEGKTVLDHASEADLKLRLTMIKATAVALIKTEKGLSRAQRRQLVAEVDRELSALDI